MVKSVDMRNSRYVHGGTSYVSNDGDLLWWERREILPATDDVPFTITSKHVHSPWLIPYEMYGDAALLWIVLQSNNILDPDVEFKEGLTLSLPSKMRVMTSILTHTPGGVNEG